MSLSEFGGYLVQHVFRANLLDFAHVHPLRKHEPPKGFATFRHARVCMTIFYLEVNFDQMKRDELAPCKKTYQKE